MSVIEIRFGRISRFGASHGFFCPSPFFCPQRRSSVAAIYTSKENHYVGGRPLLKDFDGSNATRQWFNTLTGELTEAEPYSMKNIGFGDERPWRYEADAVLIIRGLKPLKK